jgi:hypothetical protein
VEHARHSSVHHSSPGVGCLRLPSRTRNKVDRKQNWALTDAPDGLVHASGDSLGQGALALCQLIQVVPRVPNVIW